MRLTILNGLFAAVGALSLIGAKPDAAATAEQKAASDMAPIDEIRARRIVLVDDSGNARITMLAGRSASGIWVSDGNKQNAAIYVTRGQGPVLALMDERNISKGAPLAFSLDGTGKPVVQIVDGKYHGFDAVKLVPKGE